MEALRAPTAGRLVSVDVALGARVARGQRVAVLEAMKMQNDVTATRAGTISAVYVKEGEVVGPRDAIVQID